MAAAVAHLRRSCSSIFTVGFCFGGRSSWLAAASGHGLAGAIGFYGNPVSREGAPGPTERAGEMECPILALQAGRRQEHHRRGERGVRRGARPPPASSTSSSRTKARRTASSTAAQEEHAEASADAWERVLAFISRHGG